MTKVDWGFDQCIVILLRWMRCVKWAWTGGGGFYLATMGARYTCFIVNDGQVFSEAGGDSFLSSFVGIFPVCV